MSAIWSFLGGLLKGLFSLLAAFVAGKLSEKNKVIKKEANDAKKAAKIAAGASKRGDDLIDGL